MSRKTIIKYNSTNKNFELLEEEDSTLYSSLLGTAKGVNELITNYFNWYNVKNLGITDRTHEFKRDGDFLVLTKINTDNPGYHVNHIPKGNLGEASKIMEEVLEFHDAVKQGVSVMAILELADLIGAVELYLEKHHPTITVEDLKKMSDVTKRAFKNGFR